MTHILDYGRTRFCEFVDQASHDLKELPFVHTTDSYIFEDVIAEGRILPQRCKVFTGENLTYLFYGRPAFRPNVNGEPTSLQHYFPVCLLLNPGSLPRIERMFPFDSGAFVNDAYASHLHRAMKLGDFHLKADVSSAARIVSLFFEGNQSYLKGKARTKLDFPPTQFEAQSYASIISARDSNSIDNRSSAVEAQMKVEFPMFSTVAAVILPSNFADGETGIKLKSLNIDILPYDTNERSRPNEYIGQIDAICRTYYISRGFIDAVEM